MSFDSMLTMSLVIERSGEIMGFAGLLLLSEPIADDYGQNLQGWAAVATVAGLIQPKSATEVAIQSQGGAEVTDTVIYLEPTDVTPADRIRKVADTSGPYYEISGVRDAAGQGHHLELDAKRID